MELKNRKTNDQVVISDIKMHFDHLDDSDYHSQADDNSSSFYNSRSWHAID